MASRKFQVKIATIPPMVIVFMLEGALVVNMGYLRGFGRAAGMLLALTTLAAHAQMQLHAVVGLPAGAQAPHRASQVNPHPRPTPPRLPPTGIASLIGQDMLLDGAEGMMRIAKASGAQADSHFVVSALALPGTDLSDPDKVCVVKLHLVQPLALHAIVNEAGLTRYALDYKACPLQFDVLHRSVLVHPMAKACVFREVDCAAHPRGLWGPDVRTFGPVQAVANDRARGVIERRMRTLFVMLMHRTRGTTARNQLASDQAHFTTHRVMVCRNYARDAVEDFCALRLTEARVMALDAALVRAQAAHRRAKMPHLRKNR